MFALGPVPIEQGIKPVLKAGPKNTSDAEYGSEALLIPQYETGTTRAVPAETSSNSDAQIRSNGAQRTVPLSAQPSTESPLNPESVAGTGIEPHQQTKKVSSSGSLPQTAVPAKGFVNPGRGTLFVDSHHLSLDDRTKTVMLDPPEVSLIAGETARGPQASAIDAGRTAALLTLGRMSLDMAVSISGSNNAELGGSSPADRVEMQITHNQVSRATRGVHDMPINSASYQSANPELKADTKATGQTGARPETPTHTTSIIDSNTAVSTQAAPALSTNTSPSIMSGIYNPIEAGSELSDQNVHLTPDEKFHDAFVAQGADTRTALPARIGVDAPRIISAQLVEIARTLPDKPVELTLNPEELGRLRMTFQSDATTMNVVLQVERPETLDLMRRHIELLAQDMKELGYEDVNFSFQQQGDTAPGDQQESNDPEPETATFLFKTEDQLATDSRLVGAATAGVDIRI
ncbi:flagellar hook-length control protein FliK [Aliiroseovarius sp. 2305UL8-7]|uniref:flagellar hook-length control protein FliK n=1 Tax=Aliiroseovarius conchicola TaxID=3121637 RepID=UPI003527178D